jgi:hypothetical protein
MAWFYNPPLSRFFEIGLFASLSRRLSSSEGYVYKNRVFLGFSQKIKNPLCENVKKHVFQWTALAGQFSSKNTLQRDNLACLSWRAARGHDFVLRAKSCFPCWERTACLTFKKFESK